MSGGRYDYAFATVDEMATRLSVRSSPLRRAFAQHLIRVAKAMHDIEWVDSGDYGEGDEEEAIRACLPPTAEFEALLNETKALATRLEALWQEMNERRVA